MNWSSTVVENAAEVDTWIWSPVSSSVQSKRTGAPGANVAPLAGASRVGAGFTVSASG